MAITTKDTPYVNAYGSIGKLLTKIQSASVPSKVTRDFLSAVLGLHSSSFQPMIPLLKRLGFLDPNSIPTQRYKDFRSGSKSGFVMAKAIQEAYHTLYQSNEYAHKLEKKELTDLIVTVTGASKDDRAVPAIVGTFAELSKLAAFDVAEIPENIGDEDDVSEDQSDDENKDTQKQNKRNKNDNLKFGISYTINLNLPATTEVKVFDTLFKSLKRNLLDGQDII